MKIALLKGGLTSIGGLEKTTLALATSFSKHGEVIIVTSGPIPCQIPGIRIISLIEKRKNTYHHLRTFDSVVNEWLAKNRCDIIFGMERNSFQTHYRAGSGVHAAFLKRRALIDSYLKRATFRWNPQHRTILSLEKECMEKTPTIFTNSIMVKNEILEHYNTDEKRVEVIHNGAPLVAWERHFHNSLLLPQSGSFRFLFVGQGFKRKGLHFLLSALSLINQDFHLDVVGKDKKLSFYVGLCRKLHIDKKVTFWGSQKDIISFYQRADCLVIPSVYDPFANVTMEALAMGLFVITSKFNGGSEVIKKETGLVVEELCDPDCLKKCLEEALKRSKTKLSAENIRNSIQGLDISAQLDKIIRKTLDTK